MSARGSISGAFAGTDGGVRSVQGRRSNQAHQTGLAEGQTCIDCHKGIAHRLPQIAQDIGADRGGVAPDVLHPPVKAQ